MDIESMLRSKKSELDGIEVPGELESRLRGALNKRPVRSGTRIDWRVLVAGLILALLVGYNFDAVAYYGKKLVGYDQVMNGTLRQLNELGKGQIINKSCTMPSGVMVTLDGIMLDANQLIVFCSLRNPHGSLEGIDLQSSFLKGSFGRYSMNNGEGNLNNSKNEIRWTFKYDAPLFLERKLKYDFSVINAGRQEAGSISFRLNRDKAMGRTLKKSLNKTVGAGSDRMTIESVVASPTTTVINGSLQNIAELGMNQILGERMRPRDFDIQLIANGKTMTAMSEGMSTDMHGIRFRSEFDALPSKLEKLQIRIVSFGADHDVKQRVNLDKAKEDVPIRVLNQDVTINRIFESNGDLYITITSEESVILTRIYAMMDDRKVSLLETIDEKLDKKQDGTIYRTRTLHFKGTGEKLALDIQRMAYTTNCNKTINVPLD